MKRFHVPLLLALGYSMGAITMTRYGWIAAAVMLPVGYYGAWINEQFREGQ